MLFIGHCQFDKMWSRDMSGDDFSRRFEIVTETRRRWSEAEKAAIVAEASAPCTNVSAVARRHGLKPPLLFRWLKERATAASQSRSTSFMPVVVAPIANEDLPGTGHNPARTPTQAQPAAHANIEIALRNGRQVRVGANVDGAALKRIITLLED